MRLLNLHLKFAEYAQVPSDVQEKLLKAYEAEHKGKNRLTLISYEKSPAGYGGTFFVLTLMLTKHNFM